MKNILKASLMAVLVWGLDAGFSWGEQFEGEVDYNVTLSDGTQSTMNYFLKDKKARLEMTMKGHHVVDVMDLKGKKIYMLMPEQKMYMTSDIPDTSSNQAKAGGKLTKTDNTKTILGKTATEYDYVSEKGSMSSIWGASGMGFFLMGKGPGSSGGEAAWAQAAKQSGLFPLEVDSKTSKGSMSMVATKIDEKTLDDSLFTVPADYKDMKAMMQGMGGMPGMHVPGM